MTMSGEEPEQEALQLSSAAEAAEKEDTETLVGHSSLDEDDDEDGRHEDERRRRRRQHQQGAAGMEQLTYSRMAHLLAVYQNKVLESRRVIASLRRQKDSQLQAVISQLLLLEARLRREQKGIVGQLAQRDHVIAAQRQEIDRLRRDNRRLINRLKKVSEACEAECREPRVKVSRVEAEDGAYPGPGGHSASAPTSTSTPGRKSSPGVIRVATSVSELISGSNTSTNTSGGGKERPLAKPSPAVYQVSVRGGGGGDGGQRVAPPVNPNVALVRATTDRVFHKPPIAEKPRTTAARAGRGQLPPHRTQHIVRSYNGKCTIVSTISRLLEEESDANTTGSSEPSSPEATLKPPTPRVIRLARRFEEGLAPAPHQHQQQQQQPASADPASSPDSARRDDRSTKSYIMDEYEVTSGYNSDAVSDHEYENIQMVSCRDTSPGGKQQQQHAAKDKEGGEAEEEEEREVGEEEEEDNYVILRAVTENPESSNHWVDVPDDQHIYSNVEFSSGLLIKDVERVEEADETLTEEGVKDLESHRSPEDARNTRRNARNSTPKSHAGQGVLETNLDASPESPAGSEGRHHHGPDSHRAAKNVPRSRHNINLIMETDGDHMTENFEEFTLDSLELEEEREREEEARERGRGKENRPVHEPRKCGDGAETKEGRAREEVQREAMENLVGGVPSQNGANTGQYEKFLEATGLSQKSILTPTRMYYNHRSVLKPRDVKHRNKLRAAFTTLSTLEEAPGSAGGCRYWTEPYL